MRAAEHEASAGLNLPWQLPSHPVRQLLALKAIADLVAVTVLADYELGGDVDGAGIGYPLIDHRAHASRCRGASRVPLPRNWSMPPGGLG